MVNNVALCTLKFVQRVDLWLSVLTSKTHRGTKGNWELLGVCVTLIGNSVRGVCICPNSSHCICEMCAVLCIELAKKSIWVFV